MIDLSHLTHLMEHRGIARRADLVGVSDAEIQRLEQYFGVTFPASYRQFLGAFGRSAGLLSPWMAIYFDDLKEIREQFLGLLAADNFQYQLPENALLIANWESVFDFIICDDNANPAVYRFDLFQSDAAHYRLYANCFSRYLENLIENADSDILPKDFFADEDVPSDDRLIYHELPIY
jgi:hypothetical protein